MPLLLAAGTAAGTSLTGSLTGSFWRSLSTSLTRSDDSAFSPGQPSIEGLARNADIFPSTIGRQADLEASAPKALDMALALVTSAAFWWVTTGIVALGIAVLVLLRHFRSHHLRSYVAYDLLPTTTFDAAPQAVVNFAHQLGRSRPVRGWLPQSLRAVRVCFRTDEQAKLIMGLRGRQSITGVLNMQPYTQVELRRREGGELTPTAAEQDEGQITPADQPAGKHGQLTSPPDGGDLSLHARPNARTDRSQGDDADRADPSAPTDAPTNVPTDEQAGEGSQ